MSECTAATGDVVTRSIQLLATRGYHATTVDQIARAAGISRATFFRKYGSKEDMVFADHVSNLERLEHLLRRADLTAGAGLAEGVRLVFRHHVDHAARSLARHQLLQQVEPLRDRELATSYRYERVFQEFLRRVLPDGPEQWATAIALASATVAVHNAYLRTWLRTADPVHGERLAAELSRRIEWLCEVFGLTRAPAGIPPEAAVKGSGPAGARGVPSSDADAPDPPDPQPSLPAVVVVLQPGGDPATVAERTARSVYEALAEQPDPRTLT